MVKNKPLDIRLSLIVAVVNIVWFAVWIYIIFWLHNSGWWLLVPLLFNWKLKYES
jgi:hypothetical protein